MSAAIPVISFVVSAVFTRDHRDYPCYGDRGAFSTDNRWSIRSGDELLGKPLLQSSSSEAPTFQAKETKRKPKFSVGSGSVPEDYNEIIEMWECGYDVLQDISLCASWLHRNLVRFKVERSFQQWLYVRNKTYYTNKCMFKSSEQYE